MSSYQDMIKKALVLKYVLNHGGHKTKGKWKTSTSRRDGTRRWNQEHPDNPVLLRVKTGRPDAHPHDWFNTKENSKNWKRQVVAKRKKDSSDS